MAGRGIQVLDIYWRALASNSAAERQSIRREATGEPDVLSLLDLLDELDELRRQSEEDYRDK